MGGRGTKLNVNNYLGFSHERRMGEYDAIHVDGNIKFLMQKVVDVLQHRSFPIQKEDYM